MKNSTILIVAGIIIMIVGGIVFMNNGQKNNDSGSTSTQMTATAKLANAWSNDSKPITQPATIPVIIFFVGIVVTAAGLYDSRRTVGG